MLVSEELLEMARNLSDKEFKRKQKLQNEEIERDRVFDKLLDVVDGYGTHSKLSVVRATLKKATIPGGDFHKRFMSVMEKKIADLTREGDEQERWIECLMDTSNDS